jgi:hypothetical protein
MIESPNDSGTGKVVLLKAISGIVINMNIPQSLGVYEYFLAFLFNKVNLNVEFISRMLSFPYANEFISDSFR